MSVSSSWLCLFSYGYAYVHCLVYCLMFVHAMFANGYTYYIIYGYAYVHGNLLIFLLLMVYVWQDVSSIHFCCRISKPLILQQICIDATRIDRCTCPIILSLFTFTFWYVLSKLRISPIMQYVVCTCMHMWCARAPYAYISCSSHARMHARHMHTLVSVHTHACTRAICIH